MWDLELLSRLKNAIALGCAFVEKEGDGQWKKEKVMDLALRIWEELDPTPNLDLDDALVEMILDWLVDTVVENFLQSSSIDASNLS